MPDFSYQGPALERILEARRRGVHRLVAAAPTGAGKTRIICMLFEHELKQGGRPIVYTNRRILRKQLHDSLVKYGVEPGVRASGIDPNLYMDAQVSSIDTERARTLNKYHPWELHDATLAIIDEAHSNKAGTAQKIMDRHEEQEAFLIGFTATPVGLGDRYVMASGVQRALYDHLINLVSNSELRKCGVLVPCDVFAPSEIDMDGVDIGDDGDYVGTQMRDRFGKVIQTVCGNVIGHYRKLNPMCKPTVLFPPGVPESRWIADYFTQAGIPTEHIDADTPESDREAIFDRLRSGETLIVTSYGVLAEGWDFPTVQHAILCRPVAAVSTYLQLVGRILRAAPRKTRACLQDHVGAWHQPGLGSPNLDRNWSLNDTNKLLSKAEKKARQETPPKENSEPARCPNCDRILKRVPVGDYTCVCGKKFKRSTRVIIQTDGKLKKQTGATIKKKAPHDDNYFLRSAIYACTRMKQPVTVGQMYMMACRKKRAETNDPDTWIYRRNLNIHLPDKGDEQWFMPCREVYKWALPK